MNFIIRIARCSEYHSPILYIRNEIFGTFDQLISNNIFEKNVDLINIEQYMINQIASFENQNNNILFRSLGNSPSNLIPKP